MQYLKNLQKDISQSLWIRSHREPKKQRDCSCSSISTSSPNAEAPPPQQKTTTTTIRSILVAQFDEEDNNFNCEPRGSLKHWGINEGAGNVKRVLEERTGSSINNSNNNNRVRSSVHPDLEIISSSVNVLPTSSTTNFHPELGAPEQEEEVLDAVQPVVLSLTPLSKSSRKNPITSRNHLGITSFFQPSTRSSSVRRESEVEDKGKWRKWKETEDGDQESLEGELAAAYENEDSTTTTTHSGKSVSELDDPLIQLVGVQFLSSPPPGNQEEAKTGEIIGVGDRERRRRRRSGGRGTTSSAESSSGKVTKGIGSFHNQIDTPYSSSESGGAGGSRISCICQERDSPWDPPDNGRYESDTRYNTSVNSVGGVVASCSSEQVEERALLRYYSHDSLTFPVKAADSGEEDAALEELVAAAELELLESRFLSRNKTQSSPSSSSRSTTFTRDRPFSSSSSRSSIGGDSLASVVTGCESDSSSVFGGERGDSVSRPPVRFHAPVVVLPLPTSTTFLPLPTGVEGLSCSHKVYQKKKSFITNQHPSANNNRNNTNVNSIGSSEILRRTYQKRKARKRKQSVIRSWLCTNGFCLLHSPKKLLAAVFSKSKKQKRLKAGKSSSLQSSSSSSHSTHTKHHKRGFKKVSTKGSSSRRGRRERLSKRELRLIATMDHEDLIRELPQIEKLSNQERLRLAHKRRMLQLKKFQQYEKDLNSNSKKHRGDSDLVRRNLPGRHHPHHGGGKKGARRIRFRNSIMLLEAAGRNDVEEVRLLLESGVNPDVANEDGLTALHQCCIDDNEEMMKILLDYGANVNSEDSEKWTPLHAAATCGHLHLVQYLIAKGANLLAVNAEGNMPYDICDDEATLDYIESEMAQRGVTQELIEEIRALPETRMLQEMQRIHAKSGDLECRDVDGATPLHIASANGYYRVAEFLLDNHAATDVQDKDFWQPIHAAACWGHLDVLELLVQNGADLDARTKNNETPYAICEDPEIKERIIQLRTEQQTKRQNEGRKRPSRTHSTNSRTQSIRRTSQRDKGLTSKRDAADEAQMLRAREELNKENSPSPTSDVNAGGGGNTTTTVAVTGNGTTNGGHHSLDSHKNQNGNTSSEEDPEERRFPALLGRDSIGNVKVQSEEMNKLRKIAVGSGAANHNNQQLNNKNHANSNSGGNAIKMNNLFIDNNGSLRKNQNNIHKNLNDSGGSSSSSNSPVTVLSSPVLPDDNGNLLPKPEINPPVDNKVSLGGGGSSGVSLSGSRDNLVGLSSSAGNSTIDIHVSVTINTNSPVSTLTNGGGSGHGPSSHIPISPGSTIFTPPGTLSDLKKQRSLIRTSSNPLTNGGMNDSMTKYQPPASPTLKLRKFVGDPVQPVGEYGDGGKRCCVIV